MRKYHTVTVKTLRGPIPVKVRVTSAQDAINLLYDHFVKNRHSPALDPQGCFSLPEKGSYPRCAIAIQVEPASIRRISDRPTGQVFANPNHIMSVLRDTYTDIPTSQRGAFTAYLQSAHDNAAAAPHQSISNLHGPLQIEAHPSFRAAFNHTLKNICAYYNLVHPEATSWKP